MPLPTFLICGAKKAGTTALSRYLAEHPNVLMSRPKETGFFHADFDRGVDWFEQHFQHHRKESAVGEASVLTMCSAEAPRRIHEVIPDAQLIFLLRNPVERLYSHYFYDLRCGHLDPSTSFQDVIYEPRRPRHERMVRMGFYEEHLARFDPLFEEQMLVLLTEDLKRRTRSTVQEALSFIGVDPSGAATTYETHNATQHLQHRGTYDALRTVWKPVQSTVEALLPTLTDQIRTLVRSALSTEQRPPMPPNDRRYLRDLYADSIHNVEDRLGRDLSHWR
jgi:hypothetical protein